MLRAFLLGAALNLGAASAADRNLAIVGVTVVDGTGKAAGPDMTVGIEDGRNASLASVKDMPSGVQVVDGFVDVSAHATHYRGGDSDIKYEDRVETVGNE